MMMKIDFDSYRQQIISEYNSLIHLLNSGLDTEERTLKLESIDIPELDGILKNIRQKLVILACMESQIEGYKTLKNIEVLTLK